MPCHLVESRFGMAPCGVGIFEPAVPRRRSPRGAENSVVSYPMRSRLPCCFSACGCPWPLAGAQLPAASQGSVRDQGPVGEGLRRPIRSDVRDRSHGAGRVAERARSVRLSFRCNGTDAGHVSDERVPTRQPRRGVKPLFSGSCGCPHGSVRPPGAMVSWIVSDCCGVLVSIVPFHSAP